MVEQTAWKEEYSNGSLQQDHSLRAFHSNLERRYLILCGIFQAVITIQFWFYLSVDSFNVL